MELYDRYVTGCSTSQLRLRDRHVNNKYLATLDLNLSSNPGICVNKKSSILPFFAVQTFHRSGITRFLETVWCLF